MNLWGNSKKRKFELLVRYLTDQCSPQEADEVRARLAVDADLNRWAAELEQIMEAARHPHPGPADAPFDEQDFLARLNRRIDLLQDRTAGPAPFPIHRGAPDVRENDPDRPASTSDLRVLRSLPRRPAESERWTSRTRRTHRIGGPTRAALALAFVALLAVLLARAPAFWQSDAGADPDAPKTYTTDVGQRATVHLADGTSVQLNVSSHLTVPAAFPETGRVVELDGEAYFDIAHDAAHPFQVRTGRATIEVLGTQFGVRAYEDEQTVQVVVAEGEVSMQAVQAPRRDTVVLKPNHRGVVRSASPPVVHRDVVLEPYLAWTEGRLVFASAPFEEVSRQLERWYDLEVDLTVPPDSVGKLSTSFGNEPLGEILNVVAEALGLRYEREGRHITFRPAYYR